MNANSQSVPGTTQTAPSPVTISSWANFECQNFSLDGRGCILVMPKDALPGKPWIWRPQFFGAFPSVDIALLHQGFHVAYIDMPNLYGAPEAMEIMNRFYCYMTQQRGLAKNVVVEGFSRGGLYAFNWAALHPERIACLYVDAPVCDFKSWPGGKGKGKYQGTDWDLCKKAYGLSEQEAMSYPLNPIDNLKQIAAAKIPIIAVAGDADNVVPMEENILIVEKRYREMGGEIQLITKPGVGHHPHSLEDPESVVKFIMDHLPKTEI